MSSIRIAVVIFASILAGSPHALFAQKQETAPDQLVKGRATAKVETALQGGLDMADLFVPVVQTARRSVVEVRGNRRRRAYGVVIDSAGWVLTKASELDDDLICRLRDGREVKAQIAARSQLHDLALLKLEATGLKPVQWALDPKWKVGQWMVSVGHRRPPLGVGVLSTPLRTRTAPTRGFLGVEIDDGIGGALVTAVIPGSAAAKAGLLAGDLITEIGGAKIEGRQSLIVQVRRFGPDDRVNIKFRRQDENRSLAAVLGTPESVEGGGSSRQWRLSRRRGNFKTWLRHDTVIGRSECGGPVVDLRGRVVGLNIARAGRTMTLALPAKVVHDLGRDLMAEAKRIAKQDGRRAAKGAGKRDAIRTPNSSSPAKPGGASQTAGAKPAPSGSPR